MNHPSTELNNQEEVPDDTKTEGISGEVCFSL